MKPQLKQPYHDLLHALPDDTDKEREAYRMIQSKVHADDEFTFVAAMVTGLMSSTAICHGLAVESGWWADPKTGERVERNDGELIALMHSELSEAMEGLRKNKQDDHLPHRKSVEVELADCLIRIFDYAGARGLDLSGAVVEKLAYNQQRADHKLAARAASDGKKF